jgi:hypothetical protein
MRRKRTQADQRKKAKQNRKLNRELVTKPACVTLDT